MFAPAKKPQAHFVHLRLTFYHKLYVKIGTL